MSAPSPTYPELAAARSRIVELDLEIEHLARLLDVCIAEQIRCRQVLARYKYPILTLPAEITSEIFTHFTSSDLELTPNFGAPSPSFLLQVPYEALRGFTAAMPILHSVLVGPSERYILPDTTPSHRAVPMFTLAPNLRRAVLSTKFNAFTITLPWSQLTTLTADFYIPEAIYVLGQTTALEKCTITIYGYADSAPAHSAVALPSLHSLSLYWGDGEPDDSLVALVSALTLPALDSLVVPEFFLGSDPIAALSRLRPHGSPRVMEIEEARLSFHAYKAAFPDVVLSVDSLEED
ncbi:hypothetical protein FB45DRAFT_1036604 [Roridomyces roridus]|uniref:Uncharacterized protein n=1 Tax=Roridomyces roridus TaxID=1738132 RepID=A0AAD7FD50_9AGAR|nr:hypothetical protein FB45DRAFT_1036604 [Roridomyces roridus]